MNLSTILELATLASIVLMFVAFFIERKFAGRQRREEWEKRAKAEQRIIDLLESDIKEVKIKADMIDGNCKKEMTTVSSSLADHEHRISTIEGRLEPKIS